VKRAAAASIALATCAVSGCTCGHGSGPPPTATPTTAAAAALAADAGSDRPVIVDFVGGLDACTLGHRGVLLDFGDPTMRALVHPGSISRDDDATVEHEGATWLRVKERSLTAAFYWPAAAAEEAPDGSAYVEARIRGAAARSVSIAVDGKTVGSWSIPKGEIRVQAARPPTPFVLAQGRHELSLRFVGGPRTGDETLAEVDWIHVGAGDSTEPYAAPTRADVLVDSAVGARSLRPLSLRSPSFVRCSTWVPPNATLEASLAMAGPGDADVEARLLRDRHAPIVLGTAHVPGGGAAWTPWTVPIVGLEGDGGLASVEIVVRRGAKGARVLIGEPRVITAATPSPAAAPTVRSVVLVVLGSTSAKSLAPWGGPHPAPELAKLAAAGATFTANRAVSSLASADLASMLTGLPPRAHGLDDPDARLPMGPTTIEDASRQGGLATAMFTANPITGAAFGFDRGWDLFTPHDPLEDDTGTRVFDDAATWIEAHKADRFLVVVHARGGHPPWDATPEELKAMPPAGYFGVIEPRRAAEALAKMRMHPGRFKEDDRTRAWALYDHAIDEHDAALGRLVAALHAAGREDDTAVIVTGDVAASEGPPLPFLDADGLDEPLLATPLVVRWPGAEALAGKRVDAPTSPPDIARSVLDMLGLASPAPFQGVSLLRVASGGVVPPERPLAATRAGRFAVRWGPFVLLGVRDHELRMCDLSLDPACVADVRATSPLALEPIHRWAVEALAPATSAYAREPAVLDARTVAALVRWGRPTDTKDETEEP
jgi:arylsulfatase A-like enzyme